MGTRTVSVLTLLALSLNATVAIAADAPAAAGPFGNRDTEATLDLSDAYEPEAVHVTSAAAKLANGNVTGSFVMFNAEETLVTGLQYRLELLGVGEEEGLPYMVDVVRASVALAPQESKTLLFASPLPNVPAGRYDLRIQVLTAKGRSLGWMDSAIVVIDADAASTFVKLYPGTIGIAEYGDELLPPLSGPNVDPSTGIELHGLAVNDGSADIRVKPVVEIFDFNAARVGIQTFEFSAVRVGAGESIPLNMPIQSDAAPGVYMAHVTLRDADTNETISSIAQYRYVVRGEDADVIALRLENMGTKAGEWAYGTIDLAGSADAETVTTATLRVRLVDAAGDLGSIEIPGIELTDAILSAKIRVPLERDLVGAPTIHAVLASESGATYDNAVYAGTLTPAQLSGLTADKSIENWVAWHGMARISLFLFVMALVGYGLFSLAMRVRGQNGYAFARTSMAAFLLVCFATQVTSGFAAGSGGIEVLTPKNGSEVFAPLGNTPIVALFINNPVHGQQNNFCNRQMTLSYRVDYGVCENQIANVRVLGRVTSGHLTVYDQNGAQWQTVHDKPYISDICTQAVCFASNTFNGTIDLTNAVPSNANTATLQLLAKYGKNIAMPDSSFSLNDQFLRVGWAHAMNVHLQCTPQVGCIEILKETFDAQNNRTTPVPQFTFRLDGNQTTTNDSQGRAIFQNVTPGAHTVSEIVPAGWDNFLVTPTNGTVQVAAGPNCAAVVFKNRLQPTDADLQIQKSGPTSVVRGNNASYSLVVKNNGPASATNVIVGDPLPAGTTFVAGSSDGRCQLQGSNVFCQLGTMTVNQQISLQITLNVPNANPAQCAPGSIVNQAAVQSDVQDRNLQNNQSSVTTQVTCPAPQVGCVEVLKEGFDVQGNRITTPLPNFSFRLDGNQTVTSDAQGRAIFTNVTPGSHTVSETPLAGWTMFNVTPQNGTVQVTAGNACAAVVFKNRQEPQVGCIEILKEGFTAQDQRITTPLPNFTFTLDGGRTVTSDAQGRATFTNVTAGSHTVAEQPMSGWSMFNVTPNNGVVNVTAGTNCAAVVFKNRQAALNADLQIQKTGPASVVRGDNLAYSLTVKNNGPATATNVIVGDPLPAGTTFVSASVSGGTCTMQGNSVFCQLGTMTANQQKVVTVTLKSTLDPQTCAPGTIVNQASVLADQQDTNAANNAASFTTQMTCPVAQTGCIEILKEGFDAGGARLATVPPFKFLLDNNAATFVHTNAQGRATLSNVPAGDHVVSEVTASGWTLFNTTPTGGAVKVFAGSNCAAVVFKNRQVAQNADVSVVKTGPQNAVRGGNFTYSITVTNNGPASASGVVLNDTIPTGLTNPVVNGQGCTVNNGVVRCQIGAMNVGEQRIVTINVQVPTLQTACQNVNVTNTATATVVNDNQTGNNTSSATTELRCPDPITADLQIQKSGATSVVRGQNLQYQLVVKNNGPASATNVVVGDPLPAGTTFVASASDNRCQLQGTTVFCNLGTMTKDQQISVPLTLNVTAATGTCQAGTVVNQAAVLSDTQDPNQANNQSSFTTQVTCPQQTGADVSVIKTAPSTVQRGQNIVYNIVVANAGPGAASGVVLSDAFPSSLTPVSSGTGCTVNNGTTTCAIGALASGQSRTFSFTFSTGSGSGTCQAGTVTNVAFATTASTDPNGQNNQSSATTQLTCQTVQTGCIDVIKETYDTNNNVLTPVTQFSFTLDGTRTAVNDSQGRARFENVAVGTHTVTETTQANWTQVSVTPAGGSVNVTAGSCATVTFKNRQTLGTTTGWSISKTDNESEVEPGDTLTYRITVRNLSSTRQTNVTITDTLPDEVEFQDASPNESSENGRVIRWENQTFEANETRTYEVEVEVEDDADGTLVNTAEVQGVTATDRTDIEDDDNDEDVEIELTKTASTSEVFPGGIIDYTVRIENTGDETIEDLVVTDNLPADVIIIDDGDADSRSGRRLEWEIDELEEGDEETFRYRVSVPTYMVAGQVIRNDVCVESDDLDEECESVTVSVLGIIPTTGARTDTEPNAHLKPVAKNEPSSAGDGTLPFLAMIALAGVGTGAGVGFGRKMLFGI